MYKICFYCRNIENKISVRLSEISRNIFIYSGFFDIQTTYKY